LFRPSLKVLDMHRLSLDNIEEFSESEIGTKAAKLVELNLLCESLNAENLGINVQVPEFYPLKNSAIADYLDETTPLWKEQWTNFVKLHIAAKNSLTLETTELLSKLRQLIKDAFSQTFREFGKLQVFLNTLPKDSLLMIRSTGKEDNVDFANPGGNESIPAVALEEKAITEAIGDVVVSYFSDKSLMQRLLSGDDITQPPFMPVLIQRMISESFDLKSTQNKQIVKSGVMYAQKNEIRIQLAPGHGELVVSSKGAFDSYFVTNENVVYPEIYRKSHRLVPSLVSENGKKVSKLVLRENKKVLSGSPSLSLSAALAIAKVGRYIHQHFRMPMDIEFVYDESNNTLSLVQARPIPKGDTKTVTPSAIAPDKLLSIKKQAEIQNAFVITPAGYATHVITHENQVIISDTIEQALTQYLKPQSISPIKIIIVKEIAPTTSHAAAQFNTKAIPVFAVNDLQCIRTWLKKSNPILIADTQHKLIVNGSNLTTVQEIEKALYDLQIIKQGMFKSSLPAQLTLMQQIKLPENRKNLLNISHPLTVNSERLLGDLIVDTHSHDEIKSEAALHELMSSLFTLLTTKLTFEIPKNNLYTFLINAIEQLETAKPGASDLTMHRQMLEAILIVFFNLAKNKDNTTLSLLFRQALITSAEILKCLQRFSSTQSNSEEEAQEEYLNLIAKLEALIINPGQPLLFSDSIKQFAQEKKSLLLASKVDGFFELTAKQKVYFVQFKKFGKFALNSKTAQTWDQFAVKCCKSPDAIVKLANMLKFVMDNQIASTWLNDAAIQAIDPTIDIKLTLQTLHVDILKVNAEITALDLSTTRSILSRWERKISLWSEQRKVNKLCNEFSNELLPLIDKLSLKHNLTELTKKVILKTVQNLTEIFDQSIKSMKGSFDYHKQDQLQVFILLLWPYHNLMNKWVNAVPDAYFVNWYQSIDDYDESNLKDEMLGWIATRFNSMISSKNELHLNPSGNFSVASARIGSTASFRRQFIDKELSLEDLFTLFHQNILASLVLLGQTPKYYAQLPETIQPLLNVLITLRTDPVYDARRGNTVHPAQQIDCLSIDHQYPFVIIDFNLPLKNHAAKIIVEHNQLTQLTNLTIQFFGTNWDSRLSILALCAIIEAKFNQVIEKQKAAYNPYTLSLEFVWTLTSEQTQNPAFAERLKQTLKIYAHYTFMNFVDTDSLCETILEKYPAQQLLQHYQSYLADVTLRRWNTANSVKKFVLAKAISEKIDFSHFFSEKELEDLATNLYTSILQFKSITLKNLNFLKTTCKLNISWNRELVDKDRRERYTVLETVLINGCSVKSLVECIQSNNINLSEHKKLFELAVTTNNYLLLDELIIKNKNFDINSHPNILSLLLTRAVTTAACQNFLKMGANILLSNPLTAKLTILAAFELTFQLDIIKNLSISSCTTNVIFVKGLLFKAIEKNINLTDYFALPLLQEILSIPSMPSNISFDIIKTLKKQYAITVNFIDLVDNHKGNLLSFLVLKIGEMSQETVEDFLTVIEFNNLDMNNHPHLVQLAISVSNYELLFGLMQKNISLTVQTIGFNCILNLLAGIKHHPNPDNLITYILKFNPAIKVDNYTNTSMLNEFLDNHHTKLSMSVKVEIFKTNLARKRAMIAIKLLELDPEILPIAEQHCSQDILQQLYSDPSFKRPPLTRSVLKTGSTFRFFAATEVSDGSEQASTHTYDSNTEKATSAVL